MRRIGNVVTLGTVGSNHQVMWRLSTTDTGTSSISSQRYFGVGARTGGSASHHVMTYFELRYWNSTDDISDETD